MTDTATVTFVDNAADGKKRAANVAPGVSILEAAQKVGIEIDATCGSRGRCRSCRVKILQGDVPPPTVQDTIQLGAEEVHERFRLACQTKVITDSKVMPMPPKAEVGHQILAGDSGVDDRLSLDSGVTKHVVTAKAPTEEHHQTSDLEEILARLPQGTDRNVALDVLRKIPSALRKQKGELTVTTFNERIIDVEVGDTSTHAYGMAFDIGTTSIVGNLIDLHTGEQLAAVGGVNPQAVYGGDLMSRIAYAQFDEKKLSQLRGKLLIALNDFIMQAGAEAGISPANIYKVVVVGNTCMHHIFLGVDVTYVGLAPYAPAVRDLLVYPASELPLKTTPRAQVCLLPIVAGFVGADTMACVLATRIYESEEIRALVDIGTNGEVVMGSKYKLMACSAPAGPALEGAQIRHGMRGAMGAIEKVDINSEVHCHVIGSAPAIGICGSGLIDACAKMIDAKVMDARGRLRKRDREALPHAMQARLIDGAHGCEFVLEWQEDAGKDEDITITQGDVRQIQLAKSAIYSGIVLLQKVMDVSDGQLAELMLCGGFGNYISTASAVKIRLLPPLALDKISYVGNAASMGAQMALLSETERLRAFELAQQIEHVALAARPDFQDIFVDGMEFSGEVFTPKSTRKPTNAGAGGA
ncbi:MAG: ASKHA domain-containing protein [Gammaproteobacteria bacterium]